MVSRFRRTSRRCRMARDCGCGWTYPRAASRRARPRHCTTETACSAPRPSSAPAIWRTRRLTRMADNDRVELTDLDVFSRYSLAVRSATADRAELIATLRADLDWLERPRTRAADRPTRAAEVPVEVADPDDDFAEDFDEDPDETVEEDDDFEEEEDEVAAPAPAARRAPRAPRAPARRSAA